MDALQPTPQSKSNAQRVIKIIVISDYICGFCYIGNKELRDAIEQCKDLPVRFDVEFRPFRLSNLTKDKSYKRLDYLACKFGPERGRMAWKVIESMAVSAGLKIKDEGWMGCSTNAHRLALKAYQIGGQDLQVKLVTILFEVCFAEGADISDLQFLADSGVKAGMMEREKVLKFLESDENKEEVEKMIEEARATGVAGVPFIIIDGKWALNGVQSTQCYVQIFQKLVKSGEGCVPQLCPGNTIQPQP